MMILARLIVFLVPGMELGSISPLALPLPREFEVIYGTGKMERKCGIRDSNLVIQLGQHRTSEPDAE
jgi:hypothetical protein